MSLITLQEALSFLDIGTGYFEITAENDVLNMTYNKSVEDCEDAWNEKIDVGVTSSTSADCKEGSASASLVINAGGVVANTLLATEKIDPAISLIGHKSITLWIKSSKALASGNLQLLLDESVECGSPEETLNIPALTANTWTAVALVLSDASVLDAVVSVGLKTTIALVESDTILIDAVKATQDVEISDGTYQGDDLAVELESKIDTAFSITSTVTYSSTTYKFKITVAANTITIDVSASDAALTFGFTKDPTAALSITSDQAATEGPTDIVNNINDGVDKWVKEYCKRDFEVPSTDYKEYSNGDGTAHLFLKQYPIVSVSRLSIGRNNAIKVNNTGTYTYATVSVTSTGVVLNKDGTNSANSPLLFADAGQTTIAGMVTAIGNETGWQASVVNSAYSSYASAELIEVMGLECLDASWAYLEIPDEPDDSFEIDPDSGVIHRAGGFPRGHRNIRTDYKAGYATLPEDLKLAVKMLVKMIYDRRDQEVFGVDEYRLASMARSLLTKEMPNEVREILSRYRKIEV